MCPQQYVCGVRCATLNLLPVERDAVHPRERRVRLKERGLQDLARRPGARDHVDDRVDATETDERRLRHANKLTLLCKATVARIDRLLRGDVALLLELLDVGGEQHLDQTDEEAAELVVVGRAVRVLVEEREEVREVDAAVLGILEEGEHRRHHPVARLRHIFYLISRHLPLLELEGPAALLGLRHRLRRFLVTLDPGLGQLEELGDVGAHLRRVTHRLALCVALRLREDSVRSVKCHLLIDEPLVTVRAE